MSAEQLALKITRVLRAHGKQAFLVGGVVRDRLLGIAPKDFDVATDANPAEVLRYFPGAQQVGAHFGVILVRAEREQVEVATFRSEGAYSDGRRPDQVVFETDARQDVLRRDFTINALLQDPETGQVVDYVGGKADLTVGLIRAIGEPDRRFEEDHLRMLRAVRFAARFGFEIEERTLEAIRKLAWKVREISAERVRDELIRILTQPHPRRGVELLDRAGLLVEILPEVKELQGVEQPPQFHPEGDVWTHTLMMLDMLQAPSETLAMGVLLHDIGKPATFRRADRIRFDGHVEAGVQIARRMLARLHFSTADTEQIVALIENHMRFKDVPKMKASTLKRLLRLPCFEEHLELNRADCLASNGNLDSWVYVKEALASTPEAELRPERLITGRDLIAEGFQPGPQFGRALDQIETSQLDGQITTRDEALRLAHDILDPLGGNGLVHVVEDEPEQDQTTGDAENPGK